MGNSEKRCPPPGGCLSMNSPPKSEGGSGLDRPCGMLAKGLLATESSTGTRDGATGWGELSSL